MKISYDFNVICVCPNDKEKIKYSVILETEFTIMVEDILDLSLSVAFKEMYQENLTEELFLRFEKNDHPIKKIITRGTHQGVTIVCEKEHED
jgi:hypothetical protein